MNPEEYDIMARAEDNLWWYRGLRKYLTTILDKYGHSLPSKPTVLDAGCGTGANLRCLSAYFSSANVSGFDVNTTSIDYASLKNPDLDIYVDDICKPTLHQKSYDLIISMDVIYMIELGKAMEGLKILTDSLNPGGILIINVPAMKWLFSEHDRAVHTKQRFSSKEMRCLADQLNLDLVHLSYRCFYLFPLIVLSRLPTMFGRAPETFKATSDVALPPRWINSLFTLVMYFENLGLRFDIRYPWGSSIALVARKPKLLP